MQSKPKPTIMSGMLTDVGRQRSGKVNQDSGIELSLPNGGLYAVADGMGGHAAGDLAATVALETLAAEFLAIRKGSMPERLNNSIQLANRAVLSKAVGECVGMGTTLVAALIDKGALIVAHAGDSRAYLLRGNILERLTNDHSWVAEQVRLGVLTEEEARNHQWKSVVSNVLGGEERVRIELCGLILKPGDRILLCSDGLSGVLTDKELHSILAKEDSVEHIVHAFINAANDAGGPDNITAIVIDIPFNMPSSRLAKPSYSIPSRTSNGPEYADILLSTDKSNNRTRYAMFATVYISIMCVILFQRYQIIASMIGIIIFTCLVISNRNTNKYSKAEEVKKLPV